MSVRILSYVCPKSCARVREMLSYAELVHASATGPLNIWRGITDAIPMRHDAPLQPGRGWAACVTGHDLDMDCRAQHHSASLSRGHTQPPLGLTTHSEGANGGHDSC